MLNKRLTKAIRRVTEKTKAHLPKGTHSTTVENSYHRFQDDLDLDDSEREYYQHTNYLPQTYPERPITPPHSPQPSPKQTEPTTLRRNPTLTPRSSGNFVRTMRLLIKQRKEGAQGSDIYDIFFPEQGICKARAIYFAVRLMSHLPDYIPTKSGAGEDPDNLDRLYHTIADRIYTYSYVNFFMPHGEKQESIVAKFEQELQAFNPKYLEFKGGREAIFAVHYALNAVFPGDLETEDVVKLVQLSRECIENCFESEEKLNENERQCMYNFHKLMSGVEWPDPNLIV
ncbi:hypothetical protein K493DRAFT_317160 [Basidiobolus meristosporus CBS 931.73]|uniref:Uncharacterized protein n=1 Tax=Basidiobolus meristosporus CBS 931.73 TaxID=1314790 RepID=A0A1Y1Y0T1_9FUNG|nr:hypothetical protein K493DRAFT_317160 [Basidiobolus meristosporus CBS 931.73]|eukprot:ORX91613.1 hypothetical protein K493DRAFT_317160 [Basidiobolus meristosporus CBS 931.73]